MSTAVILAGGKSRRMGKDKLQLVYDGKTFLEAAVNRFSQKFDKVYVSIGEEGKYPEIKAERVIDIYPGCGPMAGLHAALLKTEDEGVFLTAADLPFSDPDAALKIIDLCGDAAAAVIIDEQGRYEPLFGYYKKSLLPYAEKALKSGNNKMIVLFEEMPARKILISELGSLWRDNLLDNINFPEDYQRILNSN